MKKNFLIVSFMLLLISCQKNDLSKKNPKVDDQDKITGTLCVSDEILQTEISTNLKRAEFLEDLENKTALYKGRDQNNVRTAGTLYLLVVIHIVHINPNIITDAQIKTQIDVWNNDFNKRNVELSNPAVYLAGYSFNSVANCQIEFYVTQIVRKATSVVEFPMSTDMKKASSGGSNPIDPATKLNVWVCNTPTGTSWGQFPGGTPETDGIVIDYVFFSTSNPYYSGRVGTHEVGHWLNLRHIWGDRKCGDDLVNDTPIHDSASRACPPVGLLSSCKAKPKKQWMNYMDYTFGKCTYMFTDGQKRRMDAAIDLARKSYFSVTKLYPEVIL